MNFIERVMRVMTHVNIGAGLGLMTWVLWSGWQVVTGQITPSYSAAEVRALTTLAHAGHPSPSAPMRLRPAVAGTSAVPPCHELPPVVALKGTDL